MDNLGGGVDNQKTRTPDADGDKGADKPGGRADDPGTCRRPEGDGGIVLDVDRIDNLGTQIPDADRDGEADDPDGEVDNPGGGIDNPGTGRK